jgi:hypothetical protein
VVWKADESVSDERVEVVAWWRASGRARPQVRTVLTCLLKHFVICIRVHARQGCHRVLEDVEDVEACAG